MLMPPLVGQCEKNTGFSMVFRGHVSKTSGFFVYFAAASHEHRPQGRGNSALLNVTTWPSHKNKTAAQSSYDDFSAAIYWMGLSLHGPGQHGEGQHGLGQHGGRHFWFPY